LQPLPPQTAAAARPGKKERTRRELYAAGMALFAVRGFDAVTVEQICEAAGVSRATFFLHFPTKSALLIEFHHELARELAGLLAPPRGPAAQEFRRMVDLFATRWLERADAMGAMLREVLATPALALSVERESRGLRALIEDVVRHGQRTGEFRRSISPRLASTIFLATSAAILSGHVFPAGGPPPEQVREQFLEAVLHGLVKTRSETPGRAPGPGPRSLRPRRPSRRTPS
jgi:AcrR family transcriptional regulator